jgi:hypothetical protein
MMKLKQMRRAFCFPARALLAPGAGLAAVGAFLAPVIGPGLVATPASGIAAIATGGMGTAIAAAETPPVSCSAQVNGTAFNRSGWVAVSNAPYSSTHQPANALDGNMSTRFATNEPQKPGLFFQVDMKAPETFDEVAMYSPSAPTDYARGYLVEVSSNGSSWVPVASCTGTGTPEVVSFPAQTAQYIRVTLTTAESPYWWSVDEFDVYGTANCSASVSGNALGRSGWVASSNAPYSNSNEPANALDGNFSTRFSTNEPQKPGLYLEVDMRAPQSFDEVAMYSPRWPNDYARGYEVQVSNDGSSWYTVATCVGKAAPEIVSFPGQVARYLRVVLTTSESPYWWSVGELDVYSPTAPPPTTTTTTTVPAHVATTTSLSMSPNPATVGEQVTFTATVSPTPSGGSVTFVSNGAELSDCAQVAVVGGKATCTATYYRGGERAVQAFFSGNGRFLSSSSPLATETVNLPPMGYWLVTANGTVFAAEGAHWFGNFSASASTGPVVGIAGTPSGQGYWVVTSNGTVAAFGDAKFYGDLPGFNVHAKDIVAIAPTSDGHGYWLVGRDGGMFAFGNARFHGSVPGLHLHVHDIVGMVASPDGGGYLVVGADGGVFSFGSAHFYGSVPGIVVHGRHVHVHDIRAILPSSAGTGYVLVGADGGAFVFGHGVRFYGSLPGRGIRVNDIVGLALTPDDGGYFMAASNGTVYGFGDAAPGPTPEGIELPVVAIAGT